MVVSLKINGYQIMLKCLNSILRLLIALQIHLTMMVFHALGAQILNLISICFLSNAKNVKMGPNTIQELMSV